MDIDGIVVLGGGQLLAVGWIKCCDSLEMHAQTSHLMTYIAI